MPGGTLALVSLVIVLAVVALHLSIRVTPHELNCRITSELPPGTSAQNILVFLDSIGASHSGPSTSRGDADFPPGEARMIYANVGGIRKGNLLADAVVLKFRLDESDRLVNFKVYYRFSSP